MAKNRTHQVQAKKKERMTITISKDTLLQAERRARREAAIEAGTYRQSGNGVHGGTDKQRNRRDRHDIRKQMKRWGNSDE